MNERDDLLEITYRGVDLDKAFHSLSSPRDVADLLHVSLDRLHYYIDITEDPYNTFTIPKRTGGVRVISAPMQKLKMVQAKLKYILSHIYKPPGPAQGFIEGRSIVTNANFHTNKNWILNIDLEDFFPSINSSRVMGLFNKTIKLPSSVSQILTKICCYKNSLPQGAPTSPIISNMICMRMDTIFLRLAYKHGFTYTRYADDMTFSGNHYKGFEFLTKSTIAGNGAWPVIAIINKSGFNVNDDKIRFQKAHSRHEVTGLITNEKVNVRRRYIRQIRSMLHAWRVYQHEPAQREFFEKYDKKYRGDTHPTFNQIIRGKIEFVGMVSGKDDPIYLSLLSQWKCLFTETFKNLDQPFFTDEDMYNLEAS